MLNNDGDQSARDQLALLRTEMANERTLLAYLRSSLMLLATGGTVLKLLADTMLLLIMGWALIALGIGIGFWGFLRFSQFQKRFQIEEDTLES